MTIQEYIVKLIHSNGGTFHGTLRLCEQVPASRESVMHVLRQRKVKRLVHATRPARRGRGHMTVYRLTSKGLKYVQSK
jgi:hypothetical protein